MAGDSVVRDRGQCRKFVGVNVYPPSPLNNEGGRVTLCVYYYYCYMGELKIGYDHVVRVDVFILCTGNTMCFKKARRLLRIHQKYE